MTLLILPLLNPIPASPWLGLFLPFLPLAWLLALAYRKWLARQGGVEEKDVGTMGLAWILIFFFTTLVSLVSAGPHMIHLLLVLVWVPIQATRMNKDAAQAGVRSGAGWWIVGLIALAVATEAAYFMGIRDSLQKTYWEVAERGRIKLAYQRVQNLHAVAFWTNEDTGSVPPVEEAIRIADDHFPSRSFFGESAEEYDIYYTYAQCSVNGPGEACVVAVPLYGKNPYSGSPFWFGSSDPATDPYIWVTSDWEVRCSVVWPPEDDYRCKVGDDYQDRDRLLQDMSEEPASPMWRPNSWPAKGR